MKIPFSSSHRKKELALLKAIYYSIPLVSEAVTASVVSKDTYHYFINSVINVIYE